MLKKAQIAYFILIGAIILISAFFIIYLYQNKTPKSNLEQIQRLPQEIQTFDTYIRNCLKETSKDAILFVAKHGGYYNRPNLYYDNYGLWLPYYFHQNLAWYPGKQRIEAEISDYIDDNIGLCLNNLSDLPSQSDFGPIISNTAIGQKSVIINANIPIKLNLNYAAFTTKNFRTELENVRLNNILEVIQLWSIEQVKEPSSICVSCLLQNADKLGVSLHMERHQNGTFVFLVYDNSSIINDKILLFNFANKYEEHSCSNLPFGDIDFVQECAQEKVSNLHSISISPIPNLNATVGKEFVYNINASGNHLSYEGFTDLFDINSKTGLIKFTPTEEQIGNYSVWIKVENSFGDQDFANFNLEVIK